MPVMVFKRIIPAQDLFEAFENVDDYEKRIHLLKKVVTVIASQHNSGIKQDDPHPGNFLLCGDDIYTIDGSAVDTKQMGSPLSETKSVKNLGLFLAQFKPEFDNLTFPVFTFYSGIRKWPAKHNFYLQLVKEIQKSRKHRKNVYLKKIFRECSAFVCKKDLHHYMICDRNYYTSSMIQFIKNPDAVIKKSRLLKEGNSCTVAIIKPDNRPMVVKRYNIKNIRHALSRCFRPTRASISWKNANQLLFSGILTPRPVMFLEKRNGPFRSTAYFLMEYVDGIDCYNLLHSNQPKNINLKNLANKFTKMLQKLADASLNHNDFKATNFILAHDGSLYILDLDGMCECRFRWLFKRSFKKNCRRLMKNWTDLPEVSQIFKEHIDKLKL